MISVVKTPSLNCPKILFHRLIGEALLFLAGGSVQLLKLLI